jgi:dipeptidyl aminopeptidase/acylaminoacyl peptidase
MSSIYHISKDTPPVFIIHGDNDEVVPLYQALSFQQTARDKGVSVEIMVKEGAGHGWPDKASDEVHFLNWFDKHLLNSAQ